MLEDIDIYHIIKIAEEASNAILLIYNQDFLVEYKDDFSPLTQADKKANEIITNALNALAVKLPILSEEAEDVPYCTRREWEYFWMVDPLDGTKEFIKKNGDFSVNIALIYKNRPVLGVVYAPISGDVYYAKEGEGAFKNGVRLPMYPKKEGTLRVVASNSHLNQETKDFIEELYKIAKNVEFVKKGSSLKFCMIAEGSADIYPRASPTMEWDSAAAHIIVKEAFGEVVEMQNTKRELTYNKESLVNPNFVVTLKR